MKTKIRYLGLFALLSLKMMATNPDLIGDVSAIRSEGTPNQKYGSQTDDMVCGGILCSEIKDNSVRQVQEKNVKIEALMFSI